jgi:3D (Asp-Asp-Asp) domain-containing protein
MKRLSILLPFVAAYIALAIFMLVSVDRVEQVEQKMAELEQQLDTHEHERQIKVVPAEPEAQPPVEVNYKELLLESANKLDDCTITYYCCEQYPHICNAGPPYLTASETPPIPWYTCAVDPAVIPLGSNLLVDFGDGELLHLVATDTGSKIDGSDIDIVVSLHDTALELGIDKAVVYWW